MPHIRQLSNDIIGQIAAGEVVQRPAAAIKELVENSMDAGATAITIDIKDGGLTSFRVVDNGSGIEPEEIRLAFARHATSKLTTAEELVGIRTLGFRGEALASIAAVAKVTCTTRRHGAEWGVSVQNNGGTIEDIHEAACPEGTCFLIKDLFYNAPVRRKFLKKPSTEAGYISELMMRFILSHPQISFRYISDGKSIYFSPGDKHLSSAVMSIYGLQTLDSLRKVHGSMNGVLIDGFVGIGELSRGNRTHQSFILNGRLIKSPLLASALEEACKQRVMIGRFPMCILHLTMPFEATDVNVHPNKWEVRFQNEAGIRQAMFTLVSEALQEDTPLAHPIPLFQSTPPSTPAVVVTEHTHIESSATPAIPAIPGPAEKAAETTYRYPFHSTEQSPSAGVATAHSPSTPAKPSIASGFLPRTSTDDILYSASAGASSAQKLQTPILNPKQPVDPPNAFASQVVPQRTSPPAVQTESDHHIAHLPPQDVEQISMPVVQQAVEQAQLRCIGVVFNTYILLEYKDKLLLCDQHAAHERLLFEKFSRILSADESSQFLLTPVPVKLTYREYSAFLEYTHELEQAGFSVSDFGDLTVQLRAVPIMLGQSQGPDCLRDALDDLAESGRISSDQRTARIIQTSCKHALKGGEKVPVESLVDLISKILQENATPTCPHGRPLFVEVTKYELEKRFHRIQG